jgi:hypothetical protein
VCVRDCDEVSRDHAERTWEFMEKKVERASSAHAYAETSARPNVS